MNVTITYNEVDLSQFVEIHDIRRNVSNEVKLGLDSAPSVGANVTDFSIAEKYIEVDFSIYTIDRNAMKHKLAGILTSSKDVRIQFSDEPDKYYIGRRIGKIDMQEDEGYRSKGTFTLIIPDGVAHSTAYKRLTNPQVTGTKAVFTIQNDGNQPAIPIITAKHTAENGYLGIVNQTGAMEIGDIEEADTVTRKKSMVLRDYKTGTNILNGLKDADKNVAVLNVDSPSTGTVDSLNLWGRPHLRMAQRGNELATLTWTIPVDSSGDDGALNEYLWWRQIFWAGLDSQYGYMKVMVSDTEGNFLYGVETFKRSRGLTTEYNFLGSDGDGGFDILKQWTFRATHKDGDNPFNQDRGFCDMLRRDDMVQVYFWGEYKKITIPDIKGKKSKKIHVAFGAVKNKPLITHMYLDQIMYRKDFVSEFVDLPNRFAKGTDVVVNFENDSLFIDNKIDNDEAVHGSKWGIYLPPGKSTLEIYCSDWATMPELSLSFEERWL